MPVTGPSISFLRGGLLHTVRNAVRSSQSIPLSPLHSTTSRALKRKFTPIPNSTSLRQFSSTRRCLSESSSTPSQPPSLPLRERIARAVVATIPQSTHEQYYSYRKAEDLYKECRSQGEYQPEEGITGKAKYWYEECGLVPCLRNWSSISNLHIWLIMVRFRDIQERPRAKMWQQQLVNHYFFDLEDVLTKRHKVTSNSLRQKYLKQLFEQFRYAILSYDEAFIRGDAHMAVAVWRNVFLMNEDMDLQKLTVIVSYIRRILSGLEKLDEDTVLSAGIYFGNPADELAVVERFSKSTNP